VVTQKKNKWTRRGEEDEEEATKEMEDLSLISMFLLNLHLSHNIAAGAA